MTMTWLRSSVVLAVGIAAGMLGITACNARMSDSAPAQGTPDQQLEGAVVTTSQRSALAYGEAVVIVPDDEYAESCTGVLVAPRVVLTAAHCIVYVPARSWTVTAPFASGGPEAHHANAGEPMDAGFRNVTAAEYAQYELADVGALYLDAPFTNVTMPTLTPNAFASSRGAAPTFVSSVGRSTAGATAGLALSSVVMLDAPETSRAHIEYATAHVGAAGESGGPLFVEGSHKLVAVYAHADGTGKTDAWTRLDGDVYTWITEKVASHGGWSGESQR